MHRVGLLLAFLLACSSSCGSSEEPVRNEPATETAGEETHAEPEQHGTRAAPPPAEGRAVAIFAGGCFWCMEGPFEAVEGVDAVLSGYAGGPERGPSYREVSSGSTGHTEAVHVTFDPSVVTYEQLLEVFWHNVDPLDAGGQFCDRGHHYRTAIFPVDDAQRTAAEASKAAIEEQLDHDVATELESTDEFWIAEDYHQDFYRTNPAHYTRYRTGCGRDARLREVWGDAAGH